jgi:polar amino acid transport system substrate-binding protein
MKKIMRSILLISIVMIIASNAFSKVGDTLQVKVKSFPPCVVIEDDGTVTGYDIDIWNAICRVNGWTTEYSVGTSHNNILTELADKKFDVGIAGFTITEGREDFVDFSHHYLDSGLRILTLKSDPGMIDKVVSFWNNISGTLAFYGIYLIIFAHIVWALERDSDPTNNDGSFDDGYFVGVAQASYYCIVTASTVGFGDFTCKKARGKIFTAVLIISGLIAWSNLTAVLSSSYTIENLSAIKSVEDLKGKTILTQDGPSLKLLESLGANVKVVDTVGQAVDWLMLERGDAVVYDSPVILEYAKKYMDKVEVVGYLFDKQYYGFALQEGSPLRQDVNKALLQIRESGEYDSIHSKWFKKD